MVKFLTIIKLFQYTDFVIGLLHNSSKCNEQSIAAIDKDEYTGAYCQLRNNAPLEQVQGGMGDIFIKIARD